MRKVGRRWEGVREGGCEGEGEEGEQWEVRGSSGERGAVKQ